MVQAFREGHALEVGEVQREHLAGGKEWPKGRFTGRGLGTAGDLRYSSAGNKCGDGNPRKINPVTILEGVFMQCPHIFDSVPSFPRGCLDPYDIVRGAATRCLDPYAIVRGVYGCHAHTPPRELLA